MRDMTQVLSSLIVSRMNQNKEYTDNERQIFTYGIELLLNSLVKIMIYLSIGCAIGKGREVMTALFIFGALRKTSGGRHAKTSLGCFFVTGMILILGVSVPYIFRLPMLEYTVAAAVTWVIYLCFAPCDEYYKATERKAEAKRQKIKSLILSGGILTVGCFMDSYWRMLILCIAFLQGITMVELKK